MKKVNFLYYAFIHLTFILICQWTETSAGPLQSHPKKPFYSLALIDKTSESILKTQAQDESVGQPLRRTIRSAPSSIRSFKSTSGVSNSNLVTRSNSVNRRNSWSNTPQRTTITFDRSSGLRRNSAFSFTSTKSRPSFVSKTTSRLADGSWKSRLSSVFSRRSSTSSSSSNHNPSTSFSSQITKKASSFSSPSVTSFSFKNPKWWSSLFSRSNKEPSNITKDEKKLMKNPAKFFNKNIINTRYSQGALAGKGPISLQSGSIYNFGLKKIDGVTNSKNRYFLTVKPEEKQGIRGMFLSTYARESLDLKSKSAPSFIFTPELQGCTLYAGCNKNTGKLNVFHHHRRFFGPNEVKTEMVSTGKGREKIVTHKVTHPDGQVQHFPRALRYETTSSFHGKHNDELLATAIIHKGRSNKWTMSFQNFAYSNLHRIDQQDHFSSAHVKHTRIGQIPHQFASNSNTPSRRNSANIIWRPSLSGSESQSGRGF